MKYMNNHFGQSRIFGRARFMAEPAGDIGGDDSGSSGGGSGNGGSDDDKPSVEELMARLAKAESDNQKNKLALDKALKEKGEITKQYRQTMTAQEQAEIAKKEADEAKDARIKELETKMLIGEYTEKGMDAAIGMDKNTAKEFATSLTSGDVEKAFEFLGNHIKSLKAKWEEDFYASRPDIKAGNSDGKDQETLAMKKAKEYAEAHKNSKANQDVLKHYL